MNYFQIPAFVLRDACFVAGKCEPLCFWSDLLMVLVVTGPVILTTFAWAAMTGEHLDLKAENPAQPEAGGVTFPQNGKML